MAEDEMSDTSTPEDDMAETTFENMSEEEMAAAEGDVTVIASGS